MRDKCTYTTGMIEKYEYQFIFPFCGILHMPYFQWQSIRSIKNEFFTTWKLFCVYIHTWLYYTSIICWILLIFFLTFSKFLVKEKKFYSLNFHTGWNFNLSFEIATFQPTTETHYFQKFQKLFKFIIKALV